MPAPYRVHDKPPESKYADLLEFLKEFKLRMPPWAKVKPKDFRRAAGKGARNVPTPRCWNR
jgi:ribonuclease R